MSDTDLVFSALLMVSKRKSCINCWHHRDGGCNLYSSSCATSVGNHQSNPSRWTSYSEGEENERATRMAGYR